MTLTFLDYSRRARPLAIYPNVGDNLEYPTLGICSEAGELAGKVKKIQRDHAGIIPYDFRVKAMKELGDALWYLDAICHELGITLSDVAANNLSKLEDRQERGVLKGDGDDR